MRAALVTFLTAALAALPNLVAADDALRGYDGGAAPTAPPTHHRHGG